MNYDPNYFNSGNTAKQTVKLTFGMWEYRAEMTVSVGGNCKGMTIIEAAVDNAFNNLPFWTSLDDQDITRITLQNKDGDELICDDEEEDGSDWLGNMLIAAEIIEVVPDVKASANTGGNHEPR